MNLLTPPVVQPDSREELCSAAEAVGGAGNVANVCIGELRAIEHALTGDPAKSVHMAIGLLICLAYTLVDARLRISGVEAVLGDVDQEPTPAEHGRLVRVGDDRSSGNGTVA